MHRACRLAPALAFALPSLGCSRPELVAVHDLAAELPAAELSGAPATILFGAPAAEAHEERGFFGSGGGVGRFAWANRQAQLKFTWPEVRARRALLDVSPAPGLPRQTIQIALNGGHVAQRVFRSRERLLFELPVRFQKPGDNRL